MNLSKKSGWKALLLLVALLIASASGACRVRQTEEGEVPDVDVSVEGGKLPEYDVDVPDVEVTTEKREVTVPDIDVKTEKREITVPKVKVEPPREGDQDTPPEQKPPN